VAILNADHDKLSGIEVTRRIKQNLPEVAVILILDSANEEVLFSALKSGASACLTKDVDPEVVVDTIRLVAKGSQPISEALFQPEIASRVLDEFEVFAAIAKQVGNLLAHLTSGEIGILRHIAQGGAKEQIAGALGINEATISHKLESIRQKLVANNHKQMLLEAAQSSLPLISRVSFTGKPGAEYITKEEFESFKESLKERFKSFSGEIS
jgi:DNA-binding NarL/FixJ family response regulator